MKTFLLCLFLLLPCSAMAGQLSSDFVGKVVDANGQAVAGATLVVENLDTGRITRHVAGKTGRWHAVGKRSDSNYRISCYAPGASVPTVQFEGEVSLGQTHKRNCVLGNLNAQSPKWLSSWTWRQAPGDRYVVAVTR